MKINFLMNYIHGGWSPEDKRLGGTEESVIRWGKMLEERGHTVVIYDNDTRDNYAGGGDICINVKSSDVPPKEPTLYLTNETDAGDKDLSAYDAVVWPSQWADDNIPVNNSRRFIVPHGYDETKIYPKTKVPLRCLYASSPDRGLDTLERIWPSVVARHPEAHLYVTYGGQLSAPNTTCGEFTEDEMNELFNTSDIWLHPCSGGELFGISAIKAQAAGAIPVYFPTMALTETVKDGVVCMDDRDMYEKLVDLMSDHIERELIRGRLAAIKQPTWKDSTDALESAMLAICR